MKYFVELRKRKSAKGGLSKFNGQEALFLSPNAEQRPARIQIYNAKTWEVLTEDDLEATLKKEKETAYAHHAGAIATLGKSGARTALRLSAKRPGTI